MEQEKVMEHLRDWYKIQEVFKNREEIAKYLGISYSHFNAILRGAKVPPKKLLEKIIILIDYKTEKNTPYKPYSGEERKYMDFTTELRAWFSQQNKFKTQKDLAAYIGTSYSSVRKYFQGRLFPKENVRNKLYELTGIESLKSQDMQQKPIVKKQKTAINLDKIVQTIKIIEKQLSELRQSLNKKDIQAIRPNQPTHVRFSDAFYNLANEIESFRDASVKDRQKLKTMISPKDVGYVSAFLKALFDEDKFTDFILFSKYEFEKKGEDHDSNS